MNVLKQIYCKLSLFKRFDIKCYTTSKKSTKKIISRENEHEAIRADFSIANK